MEKITLPVSGQEMDFSKEELTAIVERHFGITKLQKPTEGEWFRVIPQAIHQELFQTKREDLMQENTRLQILRAFEELHQNPEKYGKPFETMMPEKIWNRASITELQKFASNLGDHMANWVEQALEWAQRISNGESWEAVCNESDTAIWHRIVPEKDGYGWIVGGSRGAKEYAPASFISSTVCTSWDIFYACIPLVVRYTLDE